MVTPEGRKFFEACLELLEQFEKVKAEITQQRELLGGVVRVAVIYSVGLQDMGFYTQQFNTRYPQAKIRLAFLHPHEVVEAVDQRRSGSRDSFVSDAASIADDDSLA